MDNVDVEDIYSQFWFCNVEFYLLQTLPSKDVNFVCYKYKSEIGNVIDMSPMFFNCIKVWWLYILVSSMSFMHI